ncbi:MAG: hypothetical protein AAB617_02835 [Patescibacteria group bacterium]
MKHSISQRIRVTKNGKVMRRAMGLGHSRASKTSGQMKRKAKSRGLNIPAMTIKKYT